jgi:hypothetical protein
VIASAVGRVLTACTEETGRVVLEFEGGHTYEIGSDCRCGTIEVVRLPAVAPPPFVEHYDWRRDAVWP